MLRALKSLGYDEVEDLRIGKYMELELAGDDKANTREAAGRDEREAARQPDHRELPDGGRCLMKFGVVVFPGSNCDHDCHYVLDSVLEQDVDYVWHGSTDVSRYDCLVLPGGFSYGDYLRTGAVARFSPVMKAIEDFAASGRMVIGICNGFQILLEAGLLPGADHEEHRPEVHLQVRGHQGRDHEHARGRRPRTRGRCFASPSPTARATTRSPRTCSRR